MNNSKAGLFSFALPIASGFLAFICGLLFWGLFRSSLDLLFLNWGDGDYSFAWLIPFVVLYLAWMKRDRLSAEPVENAWWGLVPLAFGILLFWLGELGGEYYTLDISAWLILVGTLWLLLGSKKIKVLAFPLFLVLTIFPLPAFLYYKLSFQLQLISSRMGTTLLHIMGIVAHREGNVIDIGMTKLQVVQACSGLRYVFPLLVLGLIVAYFFRASIWKRIFLVLSTIPLTIFWNSTRIALTGLLWLKWGPGVAEGFLHDFSGFAIFMVSLAVLLGEMWLLGRIGKAGKQGPPRSDSLPEGEGAGEIACPAPDSLPIPAGEGSGNGRVFRLGYLPRVLTAVILLGANLICLQNIDFRQKIPIREPLSKFPLDIAEWRGIREHLDLETLKWMAMSDYTLIDFRNTSGQSINLYIAYLESQAKGASIHSPETCLPGNGWTFKEDLTLTIPVKHSRNYLNVNRVLMEQPGKKMLGYFWFPQRGRNLTNIYQIKLYNFWDALTQQRTDGALVRVLTPMSGNESVDEAGARLNEFISKVIPVLEPFIPGSKVQE
jgi:exosortase D (VPLPA-CTERM-specific)